MAESLKVLVSLLTALAVGIEIGIYPLAGQIGGTPVTVPAMLVWYVPTGLIEAAATCVLVLPLSRIKAIRLHGLEMILPKRNNN